MTDEEILHRIQALVEEEHHLRKPGEPADTERLTRLEETLDQCWDLLRQRRALREFGADDAAAKVRPVDEVEGSLQ